MFLPPFYTNPPTTWPHSLLMLLYPYTFRQWHPHQLMLLSDLDCRFYEFHSISCVCNFFTTTKVELEDQTRIVIDDRIPVMHRISDYFIAVVTPKFSFSFGLYYLSYLGNWRKIKSSLIKLNVHMAVKSLIP